MLAHVSMVKVFLMLLKPGKRERKKKRVLVPQLWVFPLGGPYQMTGKREERIISSLMAQMNPSMNYPFLLTPLASFFVLEIFILHGYIVW